MCGSGPPLAGSARISMLAHAFLKKGSDVSRIGLVLCLFNEQETDFSTNGWLPMTLRWRTAVFEIPDYFRSLPLFLSIHQNSAAVLSSPGVRHEEDQSVSQALR